MAGNWREWAAERFGLKPVRQYLLDRRVAKGRWYYGDGAALLLLLVVQVATGAMLMLSYSNSPDSAYASVRHITEVQPLGWFVRGLHYWAGGMMVVMLLVHLFRQILLGGYKSPREGTWLLGVIMFFAVLLMSFTGYLLRWDERSIYAIRVMLHMFHNVPLFGDWLVRFVQGGDEMGPLTLSRMFAIHVILLPLLLLPLVAWHLYLVIYHGVTTSAERGRAVPTVEEQRALYERDKQSEKYGEVFFPQTLVRSGAMGIVVFGIAVALTLIYGPAELYPEGNLIERSYPAEEWWFWWYSGLIALLPPAIAPAFVVLFPIASFLILVLLPFMDRNPYRGIRKRPIAAVAVVVCIIGLLYLTDLRRDDLRLRDYGDQSIWTAWPSDEPPPVPAGVVLAAEVEQGRLLFAQYGCNSCHAVARHGPGFGPDLADLEHRYSAEELRSYILQPPDGVPMPAYEGRIAAQDLERVVDYVLVAQTFPRE